MSLYDVLSCYGTAVLVKVAALALLVFVLRLLVVPFALVTVLLDRAQRAVSAAGAAVTAPTPQGGDLR